MRQTFLFFCLLASFLRAEMSEPYRSLKLLPFDGRGWYINQEAMGKLFKERQIAVVVEVGCWLGESTRHIASMLPPGGKLYAVDHWYGSPGWRDNADFNKEYADVYQHFLSNVVHRELTDVIIPIRMYSDEASRLLDVKPDLVYLDGDHAFDAIYNDLVCWYPFVKGHGILAGDDWATSAEVRAAVQKFAEENNLWIYTYQNFWRYEEPWEKR